MSNQPKRRYHPPSPDALLVTRVQASRLLSCSIATLIRAEQRGALTPVRLDPASDNSKVFYTRQQVAALAGGGVAPGWHEPTPRTTKTKSVTRRKLLKRRGGGDAAA